MLSNSSEAIVPHGSTVWVARRVNLKEQVVDFPPQPVITKDNVTMQIDSIVFFRITDAKLYTYGVDRPVSALENLNATTLRNIIGGMELDQTLTSRDIINSQMQQILDEATDAWGIKVTRVELKNIIPPAEIQSAMEKQMKAEREKRQTILEATAHKESVVARAEGDKQAKILAAEAERDAQIALAEGRARSIALVYQAEADGLKALKDANVDYTDTNKMIEEWNGCHIYERWSSLYNVAAIPTKLQGIGGIDNIESNIEILSKVEHNRWNVEKLLMGFRSTTTEEHENVNAKGKPEKDRLKDLFIHDDIRPFDQLDKNTADIDRRFSREIPKLIAN